MNVVPFEAWHVKLIRRDLADPEIFLNFLDWDKSSHAVQRLSAAYTIIDSGEIVVSAGIFKLWEGTGEIWIYYGDDSYTPKRRISVIKTMRRYLAIFMRELKLNRIQGGVRADRPQFIKFAKLFGFKEEGLMRNYSKQNDDVLMMAKYG